MLKTFLHDLHRFSLLPEIRGNRVVVGVSGGPDSLCLLHLLHQVATDLNLALFVASLDHGLRGQEGRADVAFVSHTAATWNLPVFSGTQNVTALADQYNVGIEEAARLARYTFLYQIARTVQASYIAVGHHADDQAETVLLHLIRGSGLRGLRGMQPVSMLSSNHLLPGSQKPAPVKIIRPLLGITRQQIEAYCAEHHLNPRHDATNVETKFVRNQIRHRIMPMLEAINPNVRQALHQIALVSHDDYAKLINLAEEALQRILVAEEPDSIELDLARFRNRDLAMSTRRYLLRMLLRRLQPSLRDIGFATIEQAISVALYGDTGQHASLPGDIQLSVGYHSLILHHSGVHQPTNEWPSLPANTTLPVNIPGTTPLPDSDWALATRWLSPEETAAAHFDHPLTATLALSEHASIVLRTRQPGDKFAPQGLQGHTQKLKKTLNHLRVPVWYRDSLPLLVVDGEIAWIPAPGHDRIANKFAVSGLESCVLLARWLRTGKQ